jgi:hypothetical protein
VTQQPSLDFSRVVDTSRAAFDRVRQTLTRREVIVFRALCELLQMSGREDATGGELTELLKRRHEARDVNGCRPRLTGLHDKGWIERLPARRCRAYASSAHPYRPIVPLSALHDLNPDDGGR